MFRLATLNNSHVYYFVDYIDEECTKLKWSADRDKGQTFNSQELALRFKRIYLHDRKDIFVDEQKIIH